MFSLLYIRCVRFVRRKPPPSLYTYFCLVRRVALALKISVLGYVCPWQDLSIAGLFYGSLTLYNQEKKWGGGYIGYYVGHRVILVSSRERVEGCLMLRGLSDGFSETATCYV